MKLPRRTYLGALALGATLMMACLRPRSDADSQQAQAAFRGKATYQRVCAQCHDADDLRLLEVPPKLNHLFQKQTLPSGAPATDQEVEGVIIHGRGIMPAFDQTLSEAQLDDLMKYLHTI